MRHETQNAILTTETIHYKNLAKSRVSSVVLVYDLPHVGL